MSKTNKLTCGRCGSEYIPYLDDASSAYAIEIIQRNAQNPALMYRVLYPVDLCPDCVESFKTWMLNDKDDYAFEDFKKFARESWRDKFRMREETRKNVTTEN